VPSVLENASPVRAAIYSEVCQLYGGFKSSGSSSDAGDDGEL